MERMHLSKQGIAYDNFEVFGPYLLMKKLAVGGMAEIFLARPRSTLANGRLQVIKRILPEVTRNKMYLDMFQSEIRSLMGLQHPNIVQLHDFGEIQGQPYMSMECVFGKDLRDIIKRSRELKKPIPIPFVLSVLSQLASALKHSHDFVSPATGEPLQLIHRDLTPHNVLMGFDGNLKLIDFGIAKSNLNEVNDLTKTGTLKGKVAYLSPEQVRGEAIDARADIFSLALVAFELLTLKKPYCEEGENEIAVLEKIHNCDSVTKPPSHFNAATPPELDELVVKCLRKDPNERLQTASEFQTAVRSIMQTHFKTYAYADNAKVLESLFKVEIVRDQTELRHLNLRAQHQIEAQPLNSAQDFTQVIVDKVTATAESMRRDTALIHINYRRVKSLFNRHLLRLNVFLFLLYITSFMYLGFRERNFENWAEVLTTNDKQVNAKAIVKNKKGKKIATQSTSEN